MIISILTTFFCIGFLILAIKTGNLSYQPKLILQSLKFIFQKEYTPTHLKAESIMSFSGRFSLPRVSLSLFFLFFLLLPLVWGLSLYLRTDANVLFVIFTMLWAYNWIKLTLQPDKKLPENQPQ